MSDGEDPDQTKLAGPFTRARRRAADIVNTTVDGLNQLLEGDLTDPPPPPVTDSDVSDGDAQQTPTTTSVTNTNTVTTNTTVNTNPIPTTSTNTTMVGTPPPTRHITNTVISQTHFVSEFVPNNPRAMRQFFKTLRDSLNIKYTRDDVPPDPDFLDKKCVQEWRAHIKTNNEFARALTNAFAHLTDWDKIQAACLSTCRGTTANDARRATMTFLRTKLPPNMEPVIMVSNCYEMVENFLTAVQADPAYTDPGSDSIKFTKLNSLLLASLTLCHMPVHAQPDLLKKIEKTDTVVEFMDNVVFIADEHSISKMHEITHLDKDGHVHTKHVVGNVAGEDKGAKPKGFKPDKPAATGPKDKPDKDKRWVCDKLTDKIPKERCTRCTLKGHKTKDCEGKPWCPNHKSSGHTYEDCKDRKAKLSATTSSSSSA